MPGEDKTRTGGRRRGVEKGEGGGERGEGRGRIGGENGEGEGQNGQQVRGGEQSTLHSTNTHLNISCGWFQFSSHLSQLGRGADTRPPLQLIAEKENFHGAPPLQSVP